MTHGRVVVDDQGAWSMERPAPTTSEGGSQEASTSDEAPKPDNKWARKVAGATYGKPDDHGRPSGDPESSQAAAYDDHGRHHFASEKLAVIEQDDPFRQVFVLIDLMQEYAVPLILGIIVALIMANVWPEMQEDGFLFCGRSRRILKINDPCCGRTTETETETETAVGTSSQ